VAVNWPFGIDTRVTGLGQFCRISVPRPVGKIAPRV